MPELPEVETTRRGLEKSLPGRTIVAVEAKAIKMRRPLDPKSLRTGLVDRTFSTTRRKGKYLLLDIDEGSLLVHLGMSGRLQLADPNCARPQHTHFVAILDNGLELRLTDPRRFGFVHYLATGLESDDPSLARLGLEPLTDGLVEYLPLLFRSSVSPVKSLLLDQRRVVGIGNIYATEALWRSKIHPRRSGAKVSVVRLKRLAVAVQSVLREAIEKGGTTLKDFAAPDNSPGYFTIHLAAYGREGQPCPRCDRALKTIVISGRSTAYCPRCQR